MSIARLLLSTDNPDVSRAKEQKRVEIVMAVAVVMVMVMVMVVMTVVVVVMVINAVVVRSTNVAN
jgi:hypothetical protein